MNLLAKSVRFLWQKLFVITGALFVLIPTSPLNMPYVYTDSGVFLYTGWRILNGELPYRDVWDHKPPIIFYINAAGLALADGSRWGVWAIECLCLSFAAYAAFRIMSKAFGNAPAILGTLLWLISLVFVIEGGNLTTEYTLPLQFAALWLASSALGKPTCHYWRWFSIGLIGGTAFLCKQTTIGIWISIILFLVMCRSMQGRFRQFSIEFSCFSVGVAAVCAACFSFFWLHNGFDQFWNSAFEFNFFYSTSLSGLRDRLNPVIMGITPLTTAGLLQIAGTGYMLSLALFIYKREVIRDFIPLLAICLINLPIELILISTSGRTYPHYYMTILPSLAVFAAFVFWAIFKSSTVNDMPCAAKHVLTAGIVAVFVWTSFNPYRKQVAYFRKSLNDFGLMTHEIGKLTKPGDKILLWGAEPSVNFFTGCRSPSRFVYQYPLYAKGYASEKLINEFLDDLESENPKLIIDTCNPTTPLFTFPVQSGNITKRMEHLKSRYRVAGKIREWTVYEFMANDHSS